MYKICLKASLMLKKSKIEIIISSKSIDLILLQAHQISYATVNRK